MEGDEESVGGLVLSEIGQCWAQKYSLDFSWNNTNKAWEDFIYGLFCVPCLRLFLQRPYDADMSALVILGRSCQRLLVDVEDHFRNVYSRQVGIRAPNTRFLVTWQVWQLTIARHPISFLPALFDNVVLFVRFYCFFKDVFESGILWVGKLSELGKILHAVRDVEVLSLQ